MPCWAIKRNGASLGELRRATSIRFSSKELSLSQGALALKEHELLAAVVVSKKTRFDHLVRFIPARRSIFFAYVAQLAAAEWPQHAHAMATKAILNLMLFRSVRASRCTGAVSQLCIRVANAYTRVLIGRSPQPIIHYVVV